ncbi:MAG: hypothetical protein DI626_10465 [Micavibrio aeruginosavorus]|uniref:Glycine zipper domain-containing protein n=1 Tax=Micavibrio aeruginosavorus TaxID=349221 RepID=A0A2W4ZKC8_9BACT|nr:MAG: hypothetical protein DI626_10465 [Micavibrio aeruginosavorus]
MKGAKDFMSDSAILGEYDRLQDEGGLDLVRQKIEATPKYKDISAYEIAWNGLRDKRNEMAGSDDSKYPQEIVAQEIIDIFDKDGVAGLQSATQDKKREFNALDVFDRAHHKIDSVISDFSGQNAYSKDKDILKKFDDIYENGGADAVLAKVQALNTNADDLKAYMKVRENQYALKHEMDHNGGDISWSRKNGIYAPLSVTAESLPENFPQIMRDEIYGHLEKGGLDALKAETENIKIGTSNKIAQALGRPVITPEPVIDVTQHTPDGISSKGMLGKAADTLGDVARKAGPLIGPVVGVGAAGAAYLVTGSAAEAAEVAYENIVPYGETQIDLARGDLDAAGRSASVETASIGGGMAGAMVGGVVGGPIGAVIGGVAGSVSGGMGADALLDHLPKPLENIPLKDAHAKISILKDGDVNDMTPETQSLYAYKDRPELFKEQYDLLQGNGGLAYVNIDMKNVQMPDPAYDRGTSTASMDIARDINRNVPTI